MVDLQDFNPYQSVKKQSMNNSNIPKCSRCGTIIQGRFCQNCGLDTNVYNQKQPKTININVNADVQSNFLSKVALVLSILSFMCCCIDWLFSIPAVICAVIALIKNQKDSTAWAALVISCVSFIMYIIIMIFGTIESTDASYQSGNQKNEITEESVYEVDEDFYKELEEATKLK